MSKEQTAVTTIAIIGDGAPSMLERKGIKPRNFVIGVAYAGDASIDTPFGQVGISYMRDPYDNGLRTNRVILLDCSQAPELSWRVKGGRRKIAVNDQGVGSQKVRKFEIFVATTAFQPKVR